MPRAAWPARPVLSRRAAVTRSGRPGLRRETLLPGGFASRALSQRFGVLRGGMPWLVRVSHPSDSQQGKRACPSKRSSAETRGRPCRSQLRVSEWTARCFLFHQLWVPRLESRVRRPPFLCPKQSSLPLLRVQILSGCGEK